MEWSRIRRLRPSANGWLLVGAVLSGALALVAARHYLRDREAQLVEASTRALQTRPVIVASRDLRGGELLGAGDLAVRQIPRRYATSDSLAPDAASRLVGRRLGRTRRSGDAIGDSDVDPLRSASLATLLGEGKRALTIPVDELGSFAGQLRAGDHIDLYFMPQSGGDASRIGLLLPAVPVLATGSERSSSLPATTAEGRPEFSTITLELTPDDAARVALAQHAGQLTAVLRGREDAGGVVSAVRYAKALLATPAGPRLPREPARVSMELIVGGRGSGVAEAGQVNVPAAHE